MNLLSLIPFAKGLIDKLIPDPQAKAAAHLELAKLQQTGELAHLAASTEIFKEQAATVRAEASGQGWLQRNWRPITMLTFVGLIVARWLGWAAPNLTEAEYLALWDIVQIGLGGYVVGRSVEKIAPAIAGALKK